MSGTEITAWLSAGAAGFSAVAAGFAAYLAYKGPISAARLAEDLRAAAQVRAEKLAVFYTLMEERGSLDSAASMKALNRVEAVFRDSEDVRKSLSELYHAASVQSGGRNDAFLELIHAISNDLGFEGSFHDRDFQRLFVAAQ